MNYLSSPITCLKNGWLRIYLLILFIFPLLTASTFAENPDTEKAQYQQHQVEFAILLQLLNFIEWPKDSPCSTGSIKIGVYDSPNIVKSAKQLVEKLSGNKKIDIISIGKENKDSRIEDLCIFYIDPQTPPEELLQHIENSSILTVGSTEGFLEYGGAVNFVKIDSRISFEINVKHCKQLGILFRAKALRLAHRTIN